MRHLGRSIGAAGAACAAAALVAPGPALAQQTTGRQVSATFVRALTSYCLPAILGGKTVADIPTNPAERLQQPSPEDRQVHPAAKEGGSFWEASGAPHFVFVSEPRVGVCRVTAHRLMAREALDGSAAAVFAAGPDFREFPKRALAAGAIERRFFRMEGGKCLVVLLTGNVSSSSSVLVATVAVAQPNSPAYNECLGG